MFVIIVTFIYFANISNIVKRVQQTISYNQIET